MTHKRHRAFFRGDVMSSYRHNDITKKLKIPTNTKSSFYFYDSSSICGFLYPDFHGVFGEEVFD